MLVVVVVVVAVAVVAAAVAPALFLHFSALGVHFLQAFRNNLTVEESKFLGGDVQHTHLVKGLDYALAQKVKRELENKSKKALGVKGSSRGKERERERERERENTLYSLLLLLLLLKGEEK